MKSPSPEGDLTEEDRRALRGSKFAPLPVPPPNAARPQPRIAHPGGPMTTNKAAALAKFLERKLQQPGGLKSLNSKLVELAVKNAKDTVTAASKGFASSSGVVVRHVTSFEDSPIASEDDGNKGETNKKKKKKRKKKSEDGAEIEEKKQRKKKGKNKKKKVM